MQIKYVIAVLITVASVGCSKQSANSESSSAPAQAASVAQSPPQTVSGVCQTVADCANQALLAAQAAQHAAEQATAQFHSTIKGAVVAFNATTCPAGWIEYTPAEGRFVRGIDKAGGTTDPDGQRAPGTLQADMVGPHTHTYNAVTETIHGGANDNGDHVDRTKQYTTGSDSSTGPETRPKNVALLYCVMN